MIDYNIVEWERGKKLFDVNKLLDDAINETRNLNDEELWSGIHGIYRRFGQGIC